MGDEAGAAGQKQDDDIEGRSGMTEHLNGEQRSADRPNDGVNGIPGRIDPRDFVGEKFQEIEQCPRSVMIERMAEDFERLIGCGRGRSNAG